MSVIEVGIGGGTSPGTYRVQVVHSPAGEASVTVPINVEHLLLKAQSLQHAVLASGVRSRRVIPEREQPLLEIGQQLFTALLGTGEVSGCYRASLAVCEQRAESLHVVLRVSDPLLACLPWESMHDSTLGGYVCRQVSLVRHVPVARMPAPLGVNPPLRILGVIAAPSDLPALDTRLERAQLTSALALPVAQGKVSIDWAPDATWTGLHEQLLSDTWHVVHFIGHGDFDPHRDEGVLALIGENGRAHRVGAERFVDLLRQARPMPRIVVLNACSGAATGRLDLFSGIAAALVRGGATAAVAMQYEISDDAAIAFTRGFYTAIVHGRGLDDAVSSGRAAILGLSERTMEWVTPVLYLRGTETHLFTFPSTGRADSVPAHPRDAPSPPPEAGAPTSVTPVPALAAVPAGRTSPKTTRRSHTARKAPTALGSGPATLIRTLPGAGSPTPWTLVTDLAFSPDGRVLASAHSDRIIRLWDPSTGQHLRDVRGHTKSAQGVTFTADGTQVVSASADGTIRITDPATGRVVRILTGHTKGVFGLSTSADGKLLASGGGDGTVRVWDIATGNTLHSRRTSNSQHTEYGWGSVAIAANGDILAAGVGDTTLATWNVRTGEPMRTFGRHVERIWSVTFSPDSRRLVAADDSAVRIWNVHDGKELHTLNHDHGRVFGLAFSPDGRLLATAGTKTVTIWDPATGQQLRELQGHQHALSAVAFSPDGRLLASAGYDRTVHIWA